MPHVRLHTVKQIALALAIVVVLNLFIGMGIRTFYPRPAPADFCPANLPERADKTSCEEAGGRWIADRGDVLGPRAVSFEPPPVPAAVGEFEPFCDEAAGCRQEFESAQTVYNRNIFVVWVIVGAVALGIGLRVSASPAVSSGFSFGGVIAFIVGTSTYWQDMDEVLRFAVLGVVLAVLIWLGYRHARR